MSGAVGRPRIFMSLWLPQSCGFFLDNQLIVWYNYTMKTKRTEQQWNELIRRDCVFSKVARIASEIRFKEFDKTGVILEDFSFERFRETTDDPTNQGVVDYLVIRFTEGSTFVVVMNMDDAATFTEDRNFENVWKPTWVELDETFYSEL